MMKRHSPVLLSILVLWGCPGVLYAAGLKVAPGRFIVHNVEPGRLYDIHKETGLRLTIYNDDDSTRTWVLSTHRPSERGRWETGYTEIPDARWCWFEHSEITVAAHGKAYANLYLKVPGAERYYNQHWIVTLSVSGKPGHGGIALAVDIRAQIETKSREDVKTRPDGLLGVAPGTVRFESAAPGKADAARVEIYNNDTKAHRYTIASLFDNSKIERKTYLTHSYTAIPDTNWIRREAEIRVQPGESSVLHLQLAIPGDAAGSGGKWEDLLLIQPDEGLARFVRVQVQTAKEGGAE